MLRGYRAAEAKARSARRGLSPRRAACLQLFARGRYTELLMLSRILATRAGCMAAASPASIAAAQTEQARLMGTGDRRFRRRRCRASP